MLKCILIIFYRRLLSNTLSCMDGMGQVPFIPSVQLPCCHENWISTWDKHSVSCCMTQYSNLNTIWHISPECCTSVTLWNTVVSVYWKTSCSEPSWPNTVGGPWWEKLKSNNKISRFRFLIFIKCEQSWDPHTLPNWNFSM